MNALSQITQSSSRAVELSQEVLTRLLYDPVMAAWVFFRVELDGFQEASLTECWFTPEVEVSSGAGVGKTMVVNWIFLNLSAVLIPDTVCMTLFQHFQAGKDNFWKYYRQDPFMMTPLFRSQLGGFDDDGESTDKKTLHEPGNWKVFFRNRSLIMMPAPDVAREGRGQAGQDVNRLVMDEHNEAAEISMEAVTLMYPSRVRRRVWNKHHPVWCNKIVRSSAAKTGNHPAYSIHRNISHEVRRGNPDYGLLHFCYRDWSAKKDHSGRAFRESQRDDKKMLAMGRNLSEEGRLSYIMGLWQSASRNWFSEEALAACRELGRARNVIPVTSRAADAHGEGAFYFAGVDTARSRTEKHDDGAIALLRAVPKPRPDDTPGGRGGSERWLSNQEADYQVDAVYAQRLKDADAEAWSGAIHSLHRRFGLQMILMDQGGGGGDYVTPHLGKNRQVIDGNPQEAVPIVLRSDKTVMQAHFILLQFRRAEDGMKKLWPDLAHARSDDLLKDRANTEFKSAIDRTMIGLQVSHDERQHHPNTLVAWTPEMVWSSRLISLLVRQCLAYTVAMKEDGLTYQLNASGARRFSSAEKDDFHDAFRNAYVAFRLWLLERDEDWSHTAGAGRATLMGGRGRSGGRERAGGWTVRG